MCSTCRQATYRTQVTIYPQNHITQTVTGIDAAQQHIGCQIQVDAGGARGGLQRSVIGKAGDHGTAILTNIAAGGHAQFTAETAAVTAVDDVVRSIQLGHPTGVIQSPANDQIVIGLGIDQTGRITDKGNLERVVGLDRVVDTQRGRARETVVP